MAMDTIVKIPKKARVRVVWEDKPENYTQERQKRVAKYMSEKYGVDNVQVVFKPKRTTQDGEEIEMSITDNLMDTEYQGKLFKEWLTNNNIDIDFDRFIRLDGKVNDKLSEEREIDYRYRNWAIRDIEWSNFLSYGDGNSLNFDELNGIVNVNSEPANMGGKSTMTMDLLLFLFFNQTTKGTKAISMFNRFRPDCDLVTVKGRVTIDGIDYIIERIVKRSKKRSGTEYTTRTDLKFQKIMPDGSVIELEGEQRRETDDIIKKSIGSVDDFLLTIITDGDNLNKLIYTKPTERGRIVSRFIGLEILDDKEKVVKEMRSKWAKGLKSDQYNIEELKIEIKKFVEDNETKTKEIVVTNKEILKIEEDLSKANIKKEQLISKKVEIDTEVINLRQEDIDREVDDITSKGKKKKDEYEVLKEKLEGMEDVIYDETAHNELLKDKRKLEDKEADLKYEIRNVLGDVTKTERLIKELEEGEFCPTCKQALKDVDHSGEIEENKGKIAEFNGKVDILEKEKGELLKSIDELLGEIEEYDEIKRKSSEYDKTSIMVDKIGIDLEKLRLVRREKLDLKQRYIDNIENIDKNKDIDSQVLGYSAKIDNLGNEKIEKIRLVDSLDNTIKNNTVNISKNEDIINTIKSEEDIKVIFDIYIRAVGKNGISKMVMKKVLPLINSELERLLIDTAPFSLVVEINEKQEVDFLIEKEEQGIKVSYPLNEGSGYEKTAGALGLRCILSKISCLPKPNIVVFDEVLGAVANSNLELIGHLFEKLRDMFPTIFIITHNELVKDWSDKIVTVVKEKSISRLK
jgi:DNA repair exonuclease SbcCD ATPase subunit